jgi:hypothetical protein
MEWAIVEDQGTTKETLRCHETVGCGGNTSKRNVRMLAVIYVFSISVVAAIFFAAVNEFEPNPRLALALKFIIVLMSVAAVAGKLPQSSADGLSALLP